MKKKIVSCLLVAVMCTLIGSVAYADESGSMYRADSIKSHGVLECKDVSGDNDVLLNSEDLIYLAGEMDLLEDIIDGLQYKDNPNVEYTYHYHHTGDDSASSNTIYSYDNPGGCYRSTGHTHSMIETCPSHTETTHITHEHYISGNPYHCDHCGVGGYGSNTHTCSYPDTSTVWDCGYPVNTWTVQCGWREGSIEKAEIKFSPN